MGTGKSSVGMMLAGMLGLEFVEIDELIEAEAGLSINAIFDRFGEGHFRELEKAVIGRVTSRTATGAEAPEGTVLSTGGGAVTNPELRALLRAWGKLICLTATVDAILERVGSGEERPLISDSNRRGSIEKLLKERETAYRDSDLLLDTTDKTIEEVATEVASFLQD